MIPSIIMSYFLYENWYCMTHTNSIPSYIFFKVWALLQIKHNLRL